MARDYLWMPKPIPFKSFNDFVVSQTAMVREIFPLKSEWWKLLNHALVQKLIHSKDYRYLEDNALLFLFSFTIFLWLPPQNLKNIIQIGSLPPAIYFNNSHSHFRHIGQNVLKQMPYSKKKKKDNFELQNWTKYCSRFYYIAPPYYRMCSFAFLRTGGYHETSEMFSCFCGVSFANVSHLFHSSCHHWEQLNTLDFWYQAINK